MSGANGMDHDRARPARYLERIIAACAALASRGVGGSAANAGVAQQQTIHVRQFMAASETSLGRLPGASRGPTEELWRAMMVAVLGEQAAGLGG